MSYLEKITACSTIFYGTQLAAAKDRRCLKGVGKMAVNVKIQTALQRLTQGKGEVEGSPGRVIELIRDLERRFPGIGERILEEEKIRKFVNIAVLPPIASASVRTVVRAKAGCLRIVRSA